MSTLPTCPRCAAFVEPDWPSCKICGFDPNNPLTHGSLRAPGAGARVKTSTPVDAVLAVFAIFLLVVFSYAAYQAVAYVFVHHTVPVERQFFVTVPH